MRVVVGCKVTVVISVTPPPQGDSEGNGPQML